MTVALISRAPAIKTRFFRCIKLSSIKTKFLYVVPGLLYVSFDISQAEPLVGRTRVPRYWCFLGHGAGSRQRKHKGLCRMMCYVARHLVVLLMNVPVEHRHILVRH